VVVGGWESRIGFRGGEKRAGIAVMKGSLPPSGYQNRLFQAVHMIDRLGGSMSTIAPIS